MVTMPSLAPGRSGPTQNSRQTTSTKSSAPLAGLIMWLPRRDRLPDHSELPDGCYQHPVVILSGQRTSTGDVVVLILTSFGETDIHDKFPRKRDRKLRLTYLPIHPSPHPDTNVLLHLEGHAKLRCKTYANTQKQHTVPFDILRDYDREATTTRYVLTSDSYQQLARRVRFVPLPASHPLNISSVAAATDKGPTTTTTAAPTTTPPAPVARERERLFHEPATYGTLPPVARVPAPSSVLPHLRAQAAGYANTPNNRSATLHDYYCPTVQQPIRQVAAAPPSYRTGDTLPRYYQPHAAARTEHNSSSSAGRNGDSAGWGDRLASLIKLGLGIVVFCTAVFGLWSVGMGGRRRNLV